MVDHAVPQNVPPQIFYLIGKTISSIEIDDERNWVVGFTDGARISVSVHDSGGGGSVVGKVPLQHDGREPLQNTTSKASNPFLGWLVFRLKGLWKF